MDRVDSFECSNYNNYYGNLECSWDGRNKNNLKVANGVYFCKLTVGSSKEVWEKLPWNKQSPSCEVSVIYLDDEVRVMKDIYGSTFVYIRPTISLLNSK